MENEIIKFDAPELQVIEKSKAEKIIATFKPMAKMLAEFEKAYNNVILESEKGITQDVANKAKRLRLDVGKVRIETGKLKDKQKEYIKLEDRAIMGVHNILVWAVKEKEDKLKDIEDYAEIQEQKRIDELQDERAKELSIYLEDAYDRNLSGMEQDVWIAYFESKKKEYEDRIAAEKKAEEDKIAKEKADAKERERIRKENEQLKKEAEERERKEKAEKDKREKEEKLRLEKEEKERSEREEKERVEKAKHLAELKKQEDEKDKITAELKAKLDAERSEREEKELLKQEELNKGDSDKVVDLITELETLKSKYSFESESNKRMYTDVGLLIDKVINHIQK